MTLEELAVKLEGLSTDIKWIKQSLINRSKQIDDHIDESVDFRRCVERNTTWRHAFKFILVFIIAAMGWIARGVIK